MEERVKVCVVVEAPALGIILTPQQQQTGSLTLMGSSHICKFEVQEVINRLKREGDLDSLVVISPDTGSGHRSEDREIMRGCIRHEAL